MKSLVCDFCLVSPSLVNGIIGNGPKAELGSVAFRNHTPALTLARFLFWPSLASLFCMRLMSHTGVNHLFTMVVMSNGGDEMKIVNLCSCGSCCPVVKVTDDHVEIGEEGNLCVLTSEEWETLKSKIMSKEI